MTGPLVKLIVILSIILVFASSLGGSDLRSDENAENLTNEPKRPRLSAPPFIEDEKSHLECALRQKIYEACYELDPDQVEFLLHRYNFELYLDNDRSLFSHARAIQFAAMAGNSADSLNKRVDVMEVLFKDAFYKSQSLDMHESFTEQMDPIFRMTKL